MIYEFKCYSKYQGEMYEVDLRFRDGRAIVYGDSGVGKTFLKQLIAKDSIRDINDPDRSVVWCDWKNKGLTYNVGDIRNKVIVIDNADNVLEENKKLLENLACDPFNAYLVFVRYKENMGVSLNSYGSLSVEGNKFSIRYKFKEGVWR